MLIGGTDGPGGVGACRLANLFCASSRLALIPGTSGCFLFPVFDLLLSFARLSFDRLSFLYDDDDDDAWWLVLFVLFESLLAPPCADDDALPWRFALF